MDKNNRNETKVLHSEDYCKFKIKDMYKILVEDYGFKSVLSEKFTFRKNLCVHEVSPEGYDCIFIEGSNWTKIRTDEEEEKKESGNPWRNTIFGDLNRITEKYVGEGECPDKGSNTRVVFARNIRNHNGAIIFLGVYSTEFDSETNTRVYNRISDSYTSKVSQGCDCQKAA